MNSASPNGDRLTVLIADDSALMRKKIREILESDPGIRVVACARDGKDAVNLVKQHQPDVVTMDINMPVMDGVTALQIIMMESPRPVIMLSSLTQEGALSTFECLELGAVDFVGKMSGTISVDIDKQSKEIIAKVKGAARRVLLDVCTSAPACRQPSGLAVPVPRPETARVPAAWWRLGSPPAARKPCSTCYPYCPPTWMPRLRSCSTCPSRSPAPSPGR